MQNVITGKSVYKNKLKEDEIIARYKTRWEVWGFISPTEQGSDTSWERKVHGIGRSTGGVYNFLFNTLLICTSRKQLHVGQYSVEAELIAAADLSCKIVGLIQLFIQFRRCLIQ